MGNWLLASYTSVKWASIPTHHIKSWLKHISHTFTELLTCLTVCPWSFLSGTHTWWILPESGQSSTHALQGTHSMIFAFWSLSLTGLQSSTCSIVSEMTLMSLLSLQTRFYDENRLKKETCLVFVGANRLAEEAGADAQCLLIVLRTLHRDWSAHWIHYGRLTRSYVQAVRNGQVVLTLC
jgi:hypothetical protein